MAAEIAKPGGTALPVVADVTQTLSRVAAAEWGPDGIRVITVLPAATSPAARAWRQANPAAEPTTGTTIAVDGGQALPAGAVCRAGTTDSFRTTIFHPERAWSQRPVKVGGATGNLRPW